MLLKGLYGIGSSGGYISASRLLPDPRGYSGQNIYVRGVVKNRSLKLSPGITSFVLKDENDENLKIHVNYAGNLPSDLVEGRQAITSGAMVSESTFEADKIVTGCPSKYTE
ncbi:cytochrome c maturation protein CcmE [Methanosarcina hadiensis]|uniref:cytochrome c maturation protein CcmE domain-containing protein n=1 Tax=Methanosarcina hadiensis TaxID=3078083 RepID=UPI003977341F